jgi:valyl-tRNA synthetase
MKIPKIYQPKKTESKIYDFWQKTGFFNPDKLPGRRKKTFTIVIPPPNITGSLHMGHALNAIVQDILIRWKRLKGFKTLWLPGTDHAGIATQVRVEKELRKKGKTRFDLGRKKFLKRVWQWKAKFGNIILDQLKKIGVSCDWSRTRFTMDEDYSKAVKKVFLHYYKKDWIYRKKRVINWCPRCQTSLSDLEVEYKEKKGNLWYVKYPLSDKKGNYITVATTRPETMLGDTAVAVNPKDKRYRNLIGGKAIVPLVKRKIPIIKDRLIDPEFGTGAVKITPAHDMTDFAISLKHNLPLIQVIDKTATMNKKVPASYRGLPILEARKRIVDDLKKSNLLLKTEDYTHQVPVCYRCDTTIELLPSWQWFLKMQELAKKAMKDVKNRQIKFSPANFKKIYFDWLKNIKDWCISRQIWWGHKIPIRGETDVLDTWFSSALWPFATLGWPKASKDLKEFYPTSVLVTDRGIINLWVARMIFSGEEFIKKIPFKIVFIHPTVLTREGKRMSKSLGVGIDPLNLIEKYGADATRFGITFQIMGSQDIKFVEDNIVMGRKFCNKIWNSARFVLGQIGNSKFQIPNFKLNFKNLTVTDRKIIKSLNETTKLVDKDLEKFRFGQAAHKLYNFFWHDFCDIYIEKSKKQLKDKDYKLRTQKVLLFVLLNSLRLLHPFVPFITEQIYQILPLKAKEKSLMVEKWPKT